MAKGLGQRQNLSGLKMKGWVRERLARAGREKELSQDYAVGQGKAEFRIRQTRDSSEPRASRSAQDFYQQQV